MNRKSLLILAICIALSHIGLSQSSTELTSADSIPTITKASVGVGFGSKGFTFEAEVNLHKNLSARLNSGFSTFKFSIPVDIDNREASNDAEKKLSSLGLDLNYYPFAKWTPRGFHLTLGVAYNFNNEVSILSKINESYEISDISITPEDIGKMTTMVEFQKLTPYAGIGLRYPSLWGRVGFGLYGGVYYLGSPKVEIEATKILAPNSENAAVLENNMADYKFYPNVNLSITITIY